MEPPAAQASFPLSSNGGGNDSDSKTTLMIVEIGFDEQERHYRVGGTEGLVAECHKPDILQRQTWRTCDFVTRPTWSRRPTNGLPVRLLERDHPGRKHPHSHLWRILPNLRQRGSTRA